MKEINVFADRATAGGNYSKGNQLKMKEGNTWYKADYLGYEAASEYAVSKMLIDSNLNFTPYEIAKKDFRKKQLICCVSKDFLDVDASIITINSLFSKCLGIDLSSKCAKLSIKDSISYTVEEVIKITGLSKFGEYLTAILELDAITWNEDRHFRNLAVLFTNEGFDYCPIFDNGAAFLSDMYSYPIISNEPSEVEDYYNEIEVKPFGHTFDEQLDLCEEMYGTFLQVDCKDLRKRCEEKILEFYDESVLRRIDTIFRQSRRKYSYLFR